MAHYLERQWDGRTDYEIIFVNDASKDHTIDKLNEFQARYPKAAKKLRDFLGIPACDAELVLIDPKSKPSPDTGAKIDAFCESLK